MDSKSDLELPVVFSELCTSLLSGNITFVNKLVILKFYLLLSYYSFKIDIRYYYPYFVSLLNIIFYYLFEIFLYIYRFLIHYLYCKVYTSKYYKLCIIILFTIIYLSLQSLFIL